MTVLALLYASFMASVIVYALKVILVGAIILALLLLYAKWTKQ